MRPNCHTRRLFGIQQSLAVFLLLGALSPTQAYPVSGGSVSSVAPAPSQPSLFAAALQSFMPQPRPIDLRHVQAEYQISLPIADRIEVRGATLHLVATNSVSLRAPRSQLLVRLEGVVVAQIPLDPKLPIIEATIALPPRLLKPGYRRLTFAVAQHYTEECEDPSAPELWTQIDTARSWIELEGGLASWQPTLAELPKVFDPKLWGQAQLTVLTPAKIDANVLRWGSLASQAVALRRGYAPLAVRTLTPSIAARGDRPLRLSARGIPGDAILVGTVQQIGPWLAPELLDKITGPYLGIVPLDAEAKRFVLIASGRNATEVDRALLALVALDFPYPDTPQGIVEDIEPAKLDRYAGVNLLQPNQNVHFSQLGFETKTVQGLYGQFRVEFTLPPDLWAPQNAYVHLKLHFAYGAGLREDSVVNVFLNDHFQAVIPLDSPRGGLYRGYDLAIPLASFEPGANSIRFEVAMMPLITGKCLAINTQNLQFTLFSDSRIEIPNAAHTTSLPDLALLSRTGFPYTSPAQGQGMALRIASDNGAEAAAWTLMAKLAQTQRVALTQVDYGVGTTHLPRGRHLILVGTADKLPAELLAAAPLRLGPTTRAPYPVATLPPGPGELDLFDQLSLYLRNALRLSPPAPFTQTTWITHSGRELGKWAAIMQFSSPVDAERVITVLTAADNERLRAQIEALVQPGVWAQLKDDLVLWQGQEELVAQRVGSTFIVGSAGWTVRFAYLISRAPWLWGIILTVLLIALALVTLRLLMRFKHRRHPDVIEHHPSTTGGPHSHDSAP